MIAVKMQDAVRSMSAGRDVRVILVGTRANYRGTKMSTIFFFGPFATGLCCYGLSRTLYRRVSTSHAVDSI